MKKFTLLILSILVVSIVAYAFAVDNSYIKIRAPKRGGIDLELGGAIAWVRYVNPAPYDTNSVATLLSAYPAGTDTTYTFADSVMTYNLGGNAYYGRGATFPMTRTIDLQICDATGANNNGIKGVVITVTGTDMQGASVTDSYSTTDNTPNAKTGDVAFRSVTSITIPKMDDAGAKVSVGVGKYMGLPIAVYQNSLIFGSVDGVQSATANMIAVGAALDECLFGDTTTTPDGTRDYDCVFVISPLGDYTGGLAR